MLSGRLLEELNKQINYEFYSEHIYLAAAAYCHANDWDGFANFFIMQAQEEHDHAMKFYNFINDMDGNVVLQAIEDPKKSYESVLDAFEKSLEHERFVTSRIYLLMDIASEEKEHATVSFLKWFIDEQVEEEASFKNWCSKLKRGGHDESVMYQLDMQASQRVYAPAPAANE